MASEHSGDADGGVAAEVFQRYGRSAQPESQQVVAVLKAITDVIRNEGLSPSPSSYFAAIMSALEQPSTQSSQQAVLAMLTLLAVVMPRLPNHVLRSRFAGSAKLVGSLLSVHSGEAATAKAALACLAQVLAAADPTAWLAAVPAFNQLLNFTTDPRPKVRKRATEGLLETLAGLQRSSALGAASELVLKACQRILPGPAAAAQAAAAASNKQRAAAEEAISAAVADALHLIGALKGSLPLLAPTTAKTVTELLIKLYTLRQPLLDRHTTEALAALVAAPGIGEAATRLPAAELSSLMTVVIETESLWVSSSRDPGLLTALGRVLEGGLGKLAEVDPAACAARLPRAVHALVPQLAAEQDGVRFSTFEALRGLVADCLTPEVITAAKLSRGSGAAPGPTALASLVVAVASALSARYQDAWGMALPVSGALIEKLGELNAADAAAPLLECLGALVAGSEDAAAEAPEGAVGSGGDDDEEDGDNGRGGGRARGPTSTSYRSTAEATLGTAIRALGPQAVLQVLPLQIREGLAGTAEPRTWMLPMLRRHVRHAHLGFWFKEMLPLAQDLGVRAAATSAAGGSAAASLALKYRTLELQVWHCLPAFISWATDLPVSYGTVVNTLAAAFNNRPDLHTPICQALQRACAQVRHVLVTEGRGPEFVGWANPAAHGPTAAAAGRGGGGDDDDDDGAAIATAALEDPAAAAAHGGAPPPGYGAVEAEAALSALRSFNKQWLSVLCKAHYSSDPEARGPYAAAIAAMSAVTDVSVVGGYFRAALQKLSKIILDEAAEVPPADLVTEGGADPAARRNTFLELALWLSFGLPDSAVDVLFKAAKTAIGHTQASVQKRGFKVLAVLAEAREPWLRANLPEVLKQLLGAGAASTISAARRYRLRLIRPVLVAMQQPGVELPPGLLGGDEDMEGAEEAEAASPSARRQQLAASLVAEIVLGTKEANKRTRASAYDLLVGLAHVMDELDPGQIMGSDEDDDDEMEEDGRNSGNKGGLYEFFTMVMAGLAATTPHMVSGTVLALARLTFEFAAAMQNLVAALLPPVLSLLRGKAREVVKAVLGFVKVCAMRLPVELLLPHLRPILEGVLVWAEDSKNKFKLKVRVIVERLARRCGFDAVSAAMPISDTKLLAHIRKEAAKRQRRKHAGNGSEAGSEAGDDDKRSRRSGTSRSSLARTARVSQWGHTAVFSSEEGGSEGERGAGGARSGAPGRGGAASVAQTARARSGDVRLAGGSGDPMDLLDVAASRQLARSAAGVRPAGDAGRSGDDFKRDPGTGKMLIDDEVEDGGRGGKKRRRGGDADEYDSDDSDFDDLRGVADLKYAMKKAGDSRSVRFAEATRSLAGGRTAGGRSTASAGGKSTSGRSSGTAAGAREGGGHGRQHDGAKGGKGAHSGERFKAKNASGDIKGKAKVEPYAYWTLDRRMLNRRRGKHAVASGKLAAIVSGAKEAAAKGAKGKRQAAAARAAKRQRTTAAQIE